MSKEQALAMLDQVVRSMKLDRDQHLALMQAVEVLRKELGIANGVKN